VRIHTGRRYTFGKVEQCPSGGNFRLVTVHERQAVMQGNSEKLRGAFPNWEKR
jgi:hypothetical protein